MKEIWIRIRKDAVEFRAAAVAIAIYYFAVNLIFHAFCPMVILTGIPCPGCGLTRAVFYLAIGRIGQSVQMNPMGIPIVVLLLYFFWNRYIIGRHAKGIMLLMGIALVLLVAVYIWRMYNFFPNVKPCVYTENNVLSKTFPHYEQILHDFGIL